MKESKLHHGWETWYLLLSNIILFGLLLRTWSLLPSLVVAARNVEKTKTLPDGSDNFILFAEAADTCKGVINDFEMSFFFLCALTFACGGLLVRLLCRGAGKSN